jgi:hypothetical protein
MRVGDGEGRVSGRRKVNFESRLIRGLGGGVGKEESCSLYDRSVKGTIFSDEKGTNKLITTSASTSPSCPLYPFWTTSSQTVPSRALVAKARHLVLPKACLPSSNPSSMIEFSNVR